MPLSSELSHVQDLSDIDWSFAFGRVRARLLDDREDDRALYVALYAEPAVMAHIGAAMSPAAAAALFEKTVGCNRDPAALARYWRIDDIRGGETAGIVALVRGPRALDRGELGVMLLPQWQNRGVGLPALAGMVDGVIAGRWLRDVDLLIGRHAAKNANAGRLTEALGFERQTDDGSGTVRWHLQRSDWAQRRDAWPPAVGHMKHFPNKEL